MEMTHKSPTTETLSYVMTFGRLLVRAEAAKTASLKMSDRVLNTRKVFTARSPLNATEGRSTG